LTVRDEPAHPLEIPSRRSVLESSRNWTTYSHQQIARPRERDNFERDLAVVISADDKRFFPALRVTWERSVGKAESIGGVDERHDPTWCNYGERSDQDSDEDRHSWIELGVGRRHFRADVLMTGPNSECRLAPTKVVVAMADRHGLSNMVIPGRKSLIACSTDFRIRHCLGSDEFQELIHLRGWQTTETDHE